MDLTKGSTIKRGIGNFLVNHNLVPVIGLLIMSIGLFYSFYNKVDFLNFKQSVMEQDLQAKRDQINKLQDVINNQNLVIQEIEFRQKYNIRGDVKGISTSSAMLRR